MAMRNPSLVKKCFLLNSSPFSMQYLATFIKLLSAPFRFNVLVVSVQSFSHCVNQSTLHNLPFCFIMKFCISIWTQIMALKTFHWDFWRVFFLVCVLYWHHSRIINMASTLTMTLDSRINFKHKGKWLGFAANSKKAKEQELVTILHQ